MPDAATIALFAATSLLVLLIPGPAVLFIVTRSLEHGRRAGLASNLVWLGVGRLRRPGFEPTAEQSPPVPHARLFRQGVVVNVLNPKTAIFFLAFLPQFADRGAGPLAPQVLVLGLLFVAIATCSDGTYALLAGGLGDRLRRSPRVRARIERASGVVYLALGGAAVTR